MDVVVLFSAFAVLLSIFFILKQAIDAAGPAIVYDKQMVQAWGSSAFILSGLMSIVFLVIEIARKQWIWIACTLIVIFMTAGMAIFIIPLAYYFLSYRKFLRENIPNAETIGSNKPNSFSAIAKHTSYILQIAFALIAAGVLYFLSFSLFSITGDFVLPLAQLLGVTRPIFIMGLGYCVAACIIFLIFRREFRVFAWVFLFFAVIAGTYVVISFMLDM